MRPLASNASRCAGSMPASSPRTIPARSARRSPVVPRANGALHVRAQPVGDATDPTPPADDARALPAEHDVDAAAAKPAALVEAGLGPTRRDRPRAQLEHGSLRRCALRRKLEEDALAEPRRCRSGAPRPARARERRRARAGPVTTTRADAVSPIRSASSCARARRRGASPHQRPATSESDARRARDRVLSLDARAATSATQAAQATRKQHGGARPHRGRQPDARRADEQRRPVPCDDLPPRCGEPLAVRLCMPLTASPGRGAARSARARSPAPRRDPRPTGTARGSTASRRSSARSQGRSREARRAGRPWRSPG